MMRYLAGSVGWVIIALAFQALAGIAVAAEAARCESLAAADFSTILDAPTQVTAAKLVPAREGVPEHCRVVGYVTPNVGIELNLPVSDWNGRFIEMGCGGYCGVILDILTRPLARDCDVALKKGYACIGSNQGHTSTPFDAKWAYNNLQALIDYGYRATHVAAVAGKAITTFYYSQAPAKSYFWGCSGGGRQAMVAAQKFPWDFDGILAIAPGMNLASLIVSQHWNSNMATDPDGNPLFTQEDIQVLHKAAVGHCDADDGLRDGIIEYPPACNFDPARALCQAGASGGCLSAAQVEAAREIYAGPTTSQGERILIGGVVPGQEGGIPVAGGRWNFSRDYFRYMGFMPAPGPTWQPADFDFDRDYKRLGMTEGIIGDYNPDLRKFKAAGGKLLLVHGWADQPIVPSVSTDYYETVERLMGGRAATQDFFRLFMIPGMAHCSGGEGAFAIDYFSYLEEWV